MTTKNHRVPLALALAALFAATLVPVSGAETDLTPLYTFNVGSPGDPKWVMLKLDVTEEGVTPYVKYRTSELHCPMTWATQFISGSPADPDPYNGLYFDFAYGRTGVDSRVETPWITAREAFIQNDGAEACAWQNVTVIYGELPVGTVYMLHWVAGVPFVGSASLAVEGTGVSIVGVSSGTKSFYGNESDWLGQGASVFAPPFCGSPTDLADCPPNAMNGGGLVGASAHVARLTELRFRHRPFFSFSEGHSASVANASVTYPDGSARYLREVSAEPGGLGVRAKPFTPAAEILEHSLTAPPGTYAFEVKASAEVGVINKPGWHVRGVDVWFPEEAP